MKLFQLDLGEVDRLVDAEFALRGHDAILGGLRQVEARAAGGAKLGNHFFVVRQGDFDVDAGFFFEGGDQVGGYVIRPADDAQFLGLDGAGREAQCECQRGYQDVLHQCSPFRPCPHLTESIGCRHNQWNSHADAGRQP